MNGVTRITRNYYFFHSFDPIPALLYSVCHLLLSIRILQLCYDLISQTTQSLLMDSKF